MLITIVVYAAFPFVMLAFMDVANHPVILCQATAKTLLNTDLYSC